MYTDEMPAHLTLDNKQLPIDQYINILLLFFKKLIFLKLWRLLSILKKILCFTVYGSTEIDKIK
jgi:hypothetical protein